VVIQCKPFQCSSEVSIFGVLVSLCVWTKRFNNTVFHTPQIFNIGSDHYPLCVHVKIQCKPFQCCSDVSILGVLVSLCVWTKRFNATVFHTPQIFNIGSDRYPWYVHVKIHCKPFQCSSDVSILGVLVSLCVWT